MTARRQRHARLVPIVLAAGLMAAVVPPATAGPVGNLDGTALQREPQLTPQELADNSLTDLQYPDPAEGLSMVDPPTAGNTGAASLDYPLVIPQGRGLTPAISLNYSSGSAGSWVGQGWDLSLGDISVDTRWGSPAFCSTDTGPRCGNVESETYAIDGQLLMPSAVRSDWQPRIAEREDFTRRVETEFERIIRHGDSPKNYFWEVRAKTGNIRWYGGFPDAGGPYGTVEQDDGTFEPGTRGDGAELRNDATRDPSAILSDDQGNAVRWFLSAERDVGVNEVRYYYDTVNYKTVGVGGSSATGTGWEAVGDGEACAGTCARHVYLDRVEYTSSSEVNPLEGIVPDPVPDGERPAYQVKFVRDQQRADATINARAGFLDLTRDLLTRVDVKNLKTDQPVVTYDLGYEPGAYGKSQLRRVTQTGCAAAAGRKMSSRLRQDRVSCSG